MATSKRRTSKRKVRGAPRQSPHWVSRALQHLNAAFDEIFFGSAGKENSASIGAVRDIAAAAQKLRKIRR